MKRRIAACFSAAAPGYDAAAAIQARVARICAAHVAPGDYPRVLDVGCGTGTLARLLAERLSWRLFLGLDPAPGMLAAWSPETIAQSVRLLADGEAAPVKAASLDLVVSASSLQWFLEPERSIPACLELLKPGGAFSLAVFVAGTLGELADCAAESGFGSVFPLRPVAFYRDLLAAAPGVAFAEAEEEQTAWYDEPRQALLALRLTGASFSMDKRPASAARYRLFCERYRDVHGRDGRIPVTYRAAYFWGRNG